MRAYVLNHSFAAFFDALFDLHRVCACGEVLETFRYDSLRQYSSSGRSVTCNIICPGRRFSNKECGHVLKWIVKINFFRDRYTIVADNGRAKSLVNRYITPSRPKRELNRPGYNINAPLHRMKCLVMECDLFYHCDYPSIVHVAI